MQKTLLLLFIGCVLSCNTQHKKTIELLPTEKTNTETIQKLSGKEAVNTLDSLGFFDLTSKTELATVKKEFAVSKDSLNFFWGTMRGDTTEYTDNRFFAVDCETLFEEGGLTEYLDLVTLSFEKLGLDLVYSDEKSEQVEASWTHTIKLNGVEYIAFKGTFSEYDWGNAYVNFIEMLNDQLKRQENDNRFYPILCQNDGHIVLLTPKQFDFVHKYYPTTSEYPKALQEWKRINGL